MNDRSRKDIASVLCVVALLLALLVFVVSIVAGIWTLQQIEDERARNEAIERREKRERIYYRK